MTDNKTTQNTTKSDKRKQKGQGQRVDHRTINEYKSSGKEQLKAAPEAAPRSVQEVEKLMKDQVTIDERIDLSPSECESEPGWSLEVELDGKKETFRNVLASSSEKNYEKHSVKGNHKE